MKFMMAVICLLMVVCCGLVWENRRQDRIRDRQLQTLEERIDALQLAGTERIHVPLYDGVPVKKPAAIKY